MIPIILYGEKNDTSISIRLCRVLQRNGGVLHICDGNITEYSIGTPNFLIYETDDIENFNSSSGILLFKTSQNSNTQKAALSDRIISIVESDNVAALKMLKDNGSDTVTCGMSSKDTITLSSIGENIAVLSIQREMKAVDGTAIQPSEIQVKLSKHIEGYPLLSVCAVLLLTKKSENDFLEI